MIRHNETEVTHDWSGDSQNIQWAAFYSDCEHEVLPVLSGYRVTITYNLYYIKDPLQTRPQVVRSLPLYQMFSDFLKNKDFLPNGNNN